MDDRERLVRRTFEKMREIEYQRFRHVFFEAHGTVEKYPDPEVRERRMRAYHRAEMEKAYPSYKAEAGRTSLDELERHDRQLDRAVALQGDMAWELFADEGKIMEVARKKASLEMSPEERRAHGGKDPLLFERAGPPPGPPDPARDALPGEGPLPTPAEFARLAIEQRDDAASRVLRDKGVDYGGSNDHGRAPDPLEQARQRAGEAARRRGPEPERER